MLKIINFKTEYQVSPLGVDNKKPRFSWQYSEAADITGYKISVRKDGKSAVNVWDSGWLGYVDSIGIEYGGKALESHTRYFVNAAVKTASGEIIESGEQAFETGLFDESDWKGKWVAIPVNFNGGTLLFRKVITLPKDKKVLRARAYICGLGYHEFFLNGKKIGDERLNPSVTEYAERVEYCVYPMDGLLVGDNVVGVELGYGWFGARKLNAQFYVEFDDGSYFEDHSGPANGWWVGGSPTIDNGIYSGEIYDARIEEKYPLNWATLDYEPTWANGWMYTIATDAPRGKLVSQYINPIKVCGTFKEVSRENKGNGVFVSDMGANFAGWVRIKVKGERGAAVTMKFGERLDDNGFVNQLNLRSARCSDKYILRGDGIEEFAPRFTYHGFQYVEFVIEGNAELLEVVGEHVHSSCEVVGSFKCSDETLNKLHEIAVLTERSNEHSILTDCPQRDERFGWLNDLGARLYQTAYNCDMSRFFPKFTGDITDTQLSGGQIGDTAPFYTGGRPADPVCVAYLMMPYLSYKLYGDDAPAKKEYPNLKKWVDFLLSSSDDGIMNYSYYADWVYPICFGVLADKIYVSTVSLYWHLLFMTSIAKIAGNAADEKYYAEKAENLKKTINSHYYNAKTKNYAGGTQTENSMALTLGIAPESDRKAIAENVAKDVIARNYHSTCGNVGYRHLFYVLGEFGYADVAVKMLKNSEFPGWGYMVANGATSVWERWESEMSNEMDSFDHPMFGSYDAFFYAFLGGITVADDACACDKVYIKPVTAGLDSVDCYYDSVRGRIKSSWRKSGDKTVYHVEVPYGVTAEFSAGNVNKTLTYGVYDFEA